MRWIILTYKKVKKGVVKFWFILFDKFNMNLLSHSLVRKELAEDFHHSDLDNITAVQNKSPDSEEDIPADFRKTLLRTV